MSEEVQNNTAAITSLNVAVANLVSRVDGVTVKIPNAASKDNRLADKAWVRARYDGDIEDLKANKIALENGVIPSGYLPGYVDDVLEYDARASFPPQGESGKLYVDVSTKLVYRWGGSDYVEISPSLALGETAATAFPGDRGKTLEGNVTALSGTVGEHGEELEDLGTAVEEQGTELGNLGTAVEEQGTELAGIATTVSEQGTKIAGKRDYDDLSYDKPYGAAIYYGDADSFLANAPIVRVSYFEGETPHRVEPVVYAQKTGSSGPILQWSEGNNVFLRWEISFGGFARLTFSVYGEAREETYPFNDTDSPIPTRYSVTSHGQTVTWYISTDVDALVTKSELDGAVTVVPPDGDAQTAQSADAKATYEALCKVNDAALLAVYYPEGNVTSAGQITTEGLTYSYDETNHTATLTDGKSATGDVVIPWKVVKDGKEYKVTAVGGSAFFNSEEYSGADILSVAAPTTVVTVGGNAFYFCSSLTSVSLPSVTTIGSMAFHYCTFLTSVSLPSATAIRGSAFSGCSALTSVSLPSVTSIETGVFAGCSALTSVDFGLNPRGTAPTLESDPTLGVDSFSGVPATCKIIIPLGMYDEWIAADGWKDLYAAGYKFVGYADAADVADAKSIANAAIPKYDFADAALVSTTATDAEGNEVTTHTLTLTPYTDATFVPDGTAFTVAVGGETGKARDCTLVVDCPALGAAPVITWPANFHPKTDAATDFACATGTKNVYWITEYAEGEFRVEGWQETTGGGTSGGAV